MVSKRTPGLDGIDVKILAALQRSVVRDGWNAGSTPQPAYGFPRTPPSAIVHAVPEFIWRMSVKEATWGGQG
jgi:hypothetical protein